MNSDPVTEISVVAPCLNEEKTLPPFLHSLEKQWIGIVTLKGCPKHLTYAWRLFPFELVVIDGESSDGSRHLIDQIRSRISVTGIIDSTRSLGYVRNRGALAARGNILFFSNVDTIFPPELLQDIAIEFRRDPHLYAISGRTVAIEGGILSTIAHTAFDFLRWFFCKIGRFSPSGNFLAIKRSAFHAAGGFKNLRVNEDGEFGMRLSRYARETGGKLKFNWALYVWHNAKRFKKAPIRALFFYFYVLGNFNSLIRRILKPVERKSAREF